MREYDQPERQKAIMVEQGTINEDMDPRIKEEIVGSQLVEQLGEV